MASQQHRLKSSFAPRKSGQDGLSVCASSRLTAKCALAFLIGCLQFMAAGVKTTDAAPGTVFSGPASADPMAIYWNPAATTLLKGNQALLLGGATIFYMYYDRYSSSGDDGSPFPRADMIAPKPELGFGFVTDATSERFRFGLSFFTPMLSGAKWDLEYQGKPSSTQNYIISGLQAHLFIRTMAAYKIHKKVSIGVGVDTIGIWIRTKSMTDLGAILNQASCQSIPSTCQIDSPLPRENPAFQGLTSAEGIGWGVGFVGGIFFEPYPWLRLGCSLTTGAGTIKVPVDIDVDLPPAVIDFASRRLPSLKLPEFRAQGNVNASSPPIFIFGAAVLPTPDIELAMDLHWIQKSKMSVMIVQILESSSNLITDQLMVKVIKDAYTVGLRGSYRWFDPLTLAMRMEISNNTIPNEFTTPVSIDFTKINMMLGLAWQTTPHLQLIFGGSYTILFSKEVVQSAFAPNPNPTTPIEAGLNKPPPQGLYGGLSVTLTGTVVYAF